MENPRPEKVAVVAEVRERLESSSGAILTEYRGLKVSELAQLRRNLRDAGGQYKVYKNTLVRFAVRDLGLTELEELLTGPTAIAFVDGDAAAVAKALRDYSRLNPALVVKGGLLGGNVISADRAAALADLPSREVLLARIAGGLAAPLQKMAGLLQALPRNFAYGLKALIDQGGAPGAPAAEPAAEASPEPAGGVSAETSEDAQPTPETAGEASAETSEAAEQAQAEAPPLDEVSDAPAQPEAPAEAEAAAPAEAEAAAPAAAEAPTDSESTE